VEKRGRQINHPDLFRAIFFPTSRVMRSRSDSAPVFAPRRPVMGERVERDVAIGNQGKVRPGELLGRYAHHWRRSNSFSTFGPIRRGADDKLAAARLARRGEGLPFGQFASEIEHHVPAT
jgi:hypothetical protein